MDFKKKAEEVVEKFKNDPELMAEFQKDPVKAVEKVVGMDLPDELIKKVAEGINNGEINEGMNVGDVIKKLF